MAEELYFNIELKKCLNTAAFSDDLWDWWYQRLHQAHDASVDRVTGGQRVENAKLREACAELLKMAERNDPEWLHWPEMHDELRELGVEVSE